MVYLEHRVHHGLGDSQAGDGIGDGGDWPRQTPHEVSGSQQAVAPLDGGVIIFDAGGLDQVGYLDPGRAGDLAPLAVEAILEADIEEERVLEAQALSVGTRLLGSGIQRINL